MNSKNPEKNNLLFFLPDPTVLSWDPSLDFLNRSTVYSQLWHKIQGLFRSIVKIYFSFVADRVSNCTITGFDTFLIYFLVQYKLFQIILQSWNVSGFNSCTPSGIYTQWELQYKEHEFIDRKTTTEGGGKGDCFQNKWLKFLKQLLFSSHFILFYLPIYPSLSLWYVQINILSRTM